MGGPGGDVDGVAQDPAAALGEVGVRARERGERGVVQRVGRGGGGDRDGGLLPCRGVDGLLPCRGGGLLPGRRVDGAHGPTSAIGSGLSATPRATLPRHSSYAYGLRMFSLDPVHRAVPSGGHPGALAPRARHPRKAEGRRAYSVPGNCSRCRNQPGCPAGSATPDRGVPEHAGNRRAPARRSDEFDSSVGQSAPVRSQLPSGCGTLVATAPPGSPVPVGRFCAPPVARPAPMTVFQGRTGPVFGVLRPFPAPERGLAGPNSSPARMRTGRPGRRTSLRAYDQGRVTR